MNLNPIKVKIIITGKDFEHSFIEDYNDYAEDLILCENKFSNTNINMTEENIYDYFSDGEYESKDINNLNGNHFLYGFLENLYQSSMCPERLRINKGNLKYKVKNLE